MLKRVGLKCRACGKPLAAERSTARYCGPTCRSRAWREKREALTPSVTDSKFDRMVSEERVRWLKRRGETVGSLADFALHINVLIQANNNWADAAAEKTADDLFGAGAGRQLVEGLKARARWPKRSGIR